jgi:hypothetical protein
MIEPSLAAALIRWEEALRAGRDLSLSELLPDHPELHGQLGLAIDALRGRRPARRPWLVPVLVAALIFSILAGVLTSTYFALEAHEEAARIHEAEAQIRAAIQARLEAVKERQAQAAKEK